MAKATKKVLESIPTGNMHRGLLLSKVCDYGILSKHEAELCMAGKKDIGLAITQEPQIVDGACAAIGAGIITSLQARISLGTYFGLSDEEANQEVKE